MVLVSRPWARHEDKVGPEHRDRAAIVYVRQSSRQQVLEHGESTRLQCALADRAVALGWARSRVTVIDDDLGVSAAVADARVGLEENWLPRSRWAVSASCWASRCPGWRAPAATGTSCWSCARWPGRCWPTRTGSMTPATTTTGCCWA